MNDRLAPNVAFDRATRASDPFLSTTFERKSGRTLRVLVAEAHPETRNAVASALRNRGHDVVEVRDGVALVYQLLLGPRDVFEEPQVIVADDRLPGCDGPALSALLERIGSQTPVISIAVTNDESLCGEVRREDGSMPCSQPLDAEELCGRVREVAPRA